MGGPILATGHQAYLFHPGILAKYLALDEACRRLGAMPLNVVVDQDVYDALTLELPILRAGRLGVHRVRLAEQAAEVPVGAQPGVDAAKVIRALERAIADLGASLQADLSPIIDAWRDLPAARTLAEQMAGVVGRLMSPYVGEMPWVLASDLLGTECGRSIVGRMIEDAAGCVRAYNAAAGAHPQAGLTAMRIERERVELPLWWMFPGRSRQRVYADLSDNRAILTVESGEGIAWENDGDGKGRLAPRALLLTGLMRARFCNLFIHGRGGGVYDRATAMWWRDWLGETLAPDAVVSADVRLQFDAPVAGPGEVQRAVWRAHHLPFNIDRALPPEVRRNDPKVERKREVLAHMDDDRDRARRYAAFREVRRINEGLAAAHPHLLEEAARDLESARLGAANSGIAGKRDWCFALYPKGVMEAMASGLRAMAAAGSGYNTAR